jgi:hypothetical protein
VEFDRLLVSGFGGISMRADQGSLFALAIAGGAVLMALHDRGGETGKLNLRQLLWFWLFVDGLSYLGNFGGGLGLLPKYIDLLIVSGFSLFVFWVAVRDRLPDAETAELVRTAA